MRALMNVRAARLWTCAAVLLGGAIGAQAASVTFVGNGAEIGSTSLAAVFSMSNGRLKIVLTAPSTVLAPSDLLKGVSWSMGNMPVLAVNAPGVGLPSGAKGTFAFKASIGPVSPDIWKQFPSWSATKGVSGPGLAMPGTAGLTGPVAPAGVSLTGPAVGPAITLTLPSAYDVTQNGNSWYQYGPKLAPSFVSGPLASGRVQAVAVGVPVPAAVWMGLTTLGGLLVGKRLRSKWRRDVP